MQQRHTHKPLSEDLAALLAESRTHTVTLNELMERTQGRGLYLVMILLSIPFITPIPLPGLSTVFGLVIAMLAVRLALRLPPRLPRWIGAREISRKRMSSIVQSSSKFIRFLEKLAKPRRSAWLEWRTFRFGNALLLVLMGLLLALPLPPVLPFSNSLPSWAVIVIALSIMESDGILILAGYAVAIGTLVYMVFFTGVVAAGLHRMIAVGF